MIAKIHSRTMLAIDRAIDFTLESQRTDGSWDGPLSSRAFETALVCLALRTFDPLTAHRARRWLNGHPPQQYHDLAYRYETMLSGLALGKIGNVDVSDGAMYDSVFLRKTLALYALARREGIATRSLWPEDQVLPRLAEFYARRRVLNIKGWALIDFLSGYAILLNAYGEYEQARRVALEVRDAQNEDGSWFRNTLSTSLALCATEYLDDAPAEWRQRAIHYLRATQQSDGGYSYCNIPVWDTAITLSALRLALPSSHPAFQKGLSYLCSGQNADGGWGFFPGLESENDSTSAVLDAIGMEMPKDKRVQAVCYLEQQQNEEGVWPVWRRAERPSTEVVAHIVATLRSLAPFGPTRFEQACDWLLRHQESDGSWMADWCANIPYAIESIMRAVPHRPGRFAQTVAYLQANQNADGGWGGAPQTDSNSSATACAIRACLHLGLVREARHGVQYLERTQLSSGTWVSPCEVIGPRPFRYAIHASAHAFCLHAMLMYDAILKLGK